jgi:hypothetical protein
MVSLSALGAGRRLSPRKIPGTHFSCITGKLIWKPDGYSHRNLKKSVSQDQVHVLKGCTAIDVMLFLLVCVFDVYLCPSLCTSLYMYTYEILHNVPDVNNRVCCFSSQHVLFLCLYPCLRCQRDEAFRYAFRHCSSSAGLGHLTAVGGCKAYGPLGCSSDRALRIGGILCFHLQGRRVSQVELTVCF